MKALQELQQAVDRERAEYAKAAAIPLKNKEAIMRRHRELVRSSVLAYYHQKRRAELRDYRVEVNTLGGEVNTLKDANYTLSCQLSEQTGITAELQARVNGLMEDNKRLLNEASQAAAHGNTWADVSIGSMELIQELQLGAKETRQEFDKVLEALQVSNTGKGIIQDMKRACEGINNLWALVRTSNNSAPVLSNETAANETTEEEDNTPSIREVNTAPQQVYGGALPMEVGKTGKKERIQTGKGKTVTVNNEQRGPEWGEGRAKEEFDRLRDEYHQIPRGQHTAHDLKNIIQLRRNTEDDLPNVS